jgi:hypothetical protein
MTAMTTMEEKQVMPVKKLFQKRESGNPICPMDVAQCMQTLDLLGERPNSH